MSTNLDRSVRAFWQGSFEPCLQLPAGSTEHDRSQRGSGYDRSISVADFIVGDLRSDYRWLIRFIDLQRSDQADHHWVADVQ